jgi:hypothetical protein
MQRIIVMAGDSLGQLLLEDCWDWCTALATAIGENVLLATIDEHAVPINEFVFSPGMVSHGEVVRPAADGEALDAARRSHHHG